MEKILAKGKTVEEAIRYGLTNLGIQREDAIINVQEEGRSGFLGIGKKEAEVEVSRKDDQAFYDGVLDRLLTTMGFDVDVNSTCNNGTVHINVESTEEVGGLLIGRGGRTLDALEHLIKRIGVNKGYTEKKVNLDIENYKKRNNRKRSRSKRSSNRNR